MNLLLLDEGDIIDGAGLGDAACDADSGVAPQRFRARVDGRRHRDLLRISRGAVGVELRAGLIDGLIGTARVESLDEVSAEVVVRLDRAPPAPLDLTLLLALPRPKSLKKVLQCLAAFGVKDIVLLNSFRVCKSYWQSPVLSEQGLRAQLLLGLEQGCDTVLPRVNKAPLFKPFIEDELPALIAGTDALLAHPGGEPSRPRGGDRRCTLAVGPEGGFIAYELERFEQAGFERFSLGPRPVRVEHAVAALVGRLL